MTNRMPLVTHTLVLLLATALSIPAARLLRAPLPLLQIALGVLLAAGGIEVRLVPDTFMLLFVPPLLFADAVQIPKRELVELRRIVLALALGLVVFTTVAGGLAIHALLPTMPVAVCLTLAAILSPTDTVAVTSMVGENAPRRILHILEGEALLNDASGLVCFKFAAAAAVTGAFFLPSALLGFAALAAIGIATGAAVTVLFSFIDRALIRNGMDDAVSQITLTVLLPFAVYLLADSLGGSGILAAVTAGLTLERMGVMGEVRGVVRLQMRSLWRTITAVFNGLIFLLLGLQLPDIAPSGLAAVAEADLPVWGLPGIVLAIAAILVLLRLGWVMAVVLVGTGYRRLRRQAVEWPGFAGMAAVAVAGVRGAVTLAGILSLPVALPDHPGFPHRDLLVGLAAAVIITSLLLATVLLPPLMRRASAAGLHPLTSDLDRIRALLAKATITELERNLKSDASAQDKASPKAEVVALLLAEQTRQLENLTARGNTQGSSRGGVQGDAQGAARQLALDRNRAEAAGRLRLIRIQRDELRRLAISGAADEEAEVLLTESLDREEAALVTAAGLLPRDLSPA